jgi:hypothetical protein
MGTAAREMITDPRPREIAKCAEFDRSERAVSLAIPGDGKLHDLALAIESALLSEKKMRVSAACDEFLAEAARFYSVAPPLVRVLEARPLRVHEYGLSELFGDYHVKAALIRVWMRTAIQNRVTSFGTFLNTLCHEFCHHLDLRGLGFPNSYHTRGFYQRTAILYHHCKGTPLRPLVWRRIPNNRWSIDWAKMRKQ